MRAAPGRWSARIEESFLDGLEHSGCVRAAARAAGLSVNAFYNRRDAYPEFRARWDERVGRFQEQLPGLLSAAAVQCMSPEPEGAKRRGRARLPKLNVDQAIKVKIANDNAEAKARRGARGAAGHAEREAQHEREKEELVQTAARLLGMMERRQAGERLAKGWTDAGNGIWVPPGWTVKPPAGGAGGGTAGPGDGEGR